MKNPEKHPNEPFFSNCRVSPDVKLCIVIPVKNEESYIVKVLKAFAAQVDLSGKPLDSRLFEILVLANNCSDLSVEYIKGFQQNHPDLNLFLEEVVLEPQNSNIGYVRRILMETACTRLAINNGGIILTTDGDTAVATDWISQTVSEFENGADAVGGRILLAEDELQNLDEMTRSHHIKDEKYHLLTAELEGEIMKSPYDPNPRHHQHFNGSFAITTDCYEKSGGVPHVKNLEDCAFFERLQSIDAKVRHSHHVIVRTSARCIGRTEIGLSYQLNIWKNLKCKSQDYMVESAASILERFVLKKKLKDLWKMKIEDESVLSKILQELIPEVDVSKEIPQLLKKNGYFGEWYSLIIALQSEKSQNKNPGISSIDDAIQDLELAIGNYASQDFAQTSIL
ncbi:hypothetical protein ASG31_07135 [Chryseobacterium sp. Leaf404]|uniref:glycosyltransferase n=1 Tax=unclassified Chryseobacterium TaxID=2593645 RepID=UPI0006FE52FB|nr:MULTISPECIES: glycosyltransferase family A protein [unclassified Chryseobacterium]KQT18487.1 hypothetical protein ASG31_07135 [Chryseobacterium sp. Leaf404]